MSRRGTVVRASPATFAGLEKAARRQNAKGVYIERGPHTKAAQIATWLNGQEEEDLMFGEFASAQLLVAPPPCEDSDCDDDHELATEEDVEAALDQLVSELPDSFRAAVRDDAAALVRLSRRLSPATPWLTLRIEILHEEACWRWHQDGYCGRTLVCYVGPGTLAADDAQVDWDAFEASMGEEDNEHVVSSCHEIPTNAVLLMKGDAWPGIKGSGLTHKSPRGQPPLPKRVLLKCDLTDFRPMLAYEDDPLLDDVASRSRSRSRSRSPKPPPTPRRKGLARRGRSPSSGSS
ncbi:unnamed protein product [Pelagomonas calceolata]|uniref:Uncharacterized protein n=1 Tax=Pelagomonas calceolata TaxID=35677 RepID=A0A8J2X5U2_9STRA|nr:unnamed protein product [Pelagomonas calceolata]|mmetsp:Transcript_21664/g.64729  ORF Transcript_21664/g.64729 Transcript_21664/m.64729 type:complete len:291 (-) Transcript_21664:8-880(-)